MKQSLYNIIEEQKYTLQEIELMEGELTPELEEQLTINAQQLESKSIAYLEVVKSKESFNTLITDEIKRLQAMKKVNILNLRCHPKLDPIFFQLSLITA